MIDTKIQNKADEMAKDAGFDFAKHLGKKGIYNVFVCSFNEDNDGCTGFPIFLLENEGKFHEADGRKETALMQMLEDEEDKIA